MFWEHLRKDEKLLLIDKYAYTNKLTGRPPQEKLLLFCGGIVFSRIMNNFYLDISITLLMIALVIGAARIPLKSYLRMMLVPASFLFLSILTIVISIGSEGYLYYVNILGMSIGVTADSLNTGVKLFTTVLASLTSVYFLILTTPVIQIIKVLRKLKLPKVFIELMVLIYRSIFIFLEEAASIHMAQEMKFGYEGKANSLKSISLLIKNLFIRVFMKHSEMNIALECKLYDGEFRLGD